MAHDVFISYAAEDKPIADAICAFLENNKIRCWIAPRDILPGQKYSEAIIDAVDAANIFVLIFSSNSDKSPHIMSEVQRAFNKEVIIIPFRIEAIEPSKRLEYYIGPSHWLDALTPPLENHIKNLKKTIELLLSSKIKDNHTFIGVSEEESSRYNKKTEEVSQPIQSELHYSSPQSYYKPILILSAVVFLIIALIIGFAMIGSEREDPKGSTVTTTIPTPISTPTATVRTKVTTTFPTPISTPTATVRTKVATTIPTPISTPIKRLANPTALSSGFSHTKEPDWDNPSSYTDFGCGYCAVSWIKLSNMQAGDEITWKWTNMDMYPSASHQATYIWKTADGSTKIVRDENNWCGLQGANGKWTVVIYVNGVELARGVYTRYC